MGSPVGFGNGSNYVYASSGTSSSRRIASPDEVSSAGGGAPSGARGPKKKSWSFGTWAQNFLKGGIVDTIKDMLNPTSLLVMAGLAALWFIPGCQGIAAGATYAAIAGGVVFGGGKLITKGATSITKAIDGDVDGSYEDARSAGNGFATL
ncbi:MAG: hypothetical protein K2X66_16515, partial [Cyanobacteria bacterium]|nr:hypothetical protein [Cyanobacteriota bacterium]